MKGLGCRVWGSRGLDSMDEGCPSFHQGYCKGSLKGYYMGSRALALRI